MIQHAGWFAQNAPVLTSAVGTMMDRYVAPYVARQIVKAGLARKAELQVSYAIGRAEPVSLYLDTLGTGDDEAARPYGKSPTSGQRR